MKNLQEFYNSFVTEAKKMTAKDVEEIAANAKNAEDVNKKDVKIDTGVDNKTWAVDPPYPDWEKRYADMVIDDLDNNAYRLSHKLDNKRDFFVQGKAGWAKTTVIEQMAKTHGYHIVTVYLDKAEATDLGGIPVAEKTKGGRLRQQHVVPPWVAEIYENPNNKYLLFFDEMNQAQPDVLNALMPIILKHVICGIEFNNILVGAAGNLPEENTYGVFDIKQNKPLYDRLKPIIKWETNTDQAWDTAIKYLHSAHDKQLGPEIIDDIAALSEYWNSPRDIERVILEVLEAERKRDNKKRYSRKEVIYDMLEAITLDGANTDSREFVKRNDELANKLCLFVKGESAERTKRRKKNSENIDPVVKSAMMEALKDGYFHNGSDNFEEGQDADGDNYLCTLENIVSDDYYGIWPTDCGVTAEILEQWVETMEAAGTPPMFKTFEEGVKAVKSGKLSDVIIPEKNDFLVKGKLKQYSNGQAEPEQKPAARKHNDD